MKTVSEKFERTPMHSLSLLDHQLATILEGAPLNRFSELVFLMETLLKAFLKTSLNV